MNQFKSSFRVAMLILLSFLIVAVFVIRLYAIQVTNGRSELPENTYIYQISVPAARGQILDRNGNVLVGNRASFNILLVNDVLFSAESPNENLRILTNKAAELGVELNSHFPVTESKPYEYCLDDYPSTWSTYLRKWLSYRDWDTDISAPQLIRKMRDRWNIPDDWSEDEARRVMSVRYELELRYCTNLPVYEVLVDVDAESLAALMELNVPGTLVQTSTVREYHTEYAAHVLGTVGPMDAEKWEKYEPLGYSMDATVGLSGFELAFEEELHGTNGLRQTTISADGTIIEDYYIQEPKAGNNVVLTIDLNMQEVTEDSLTQLMDLLHEGASEGKAGSDAEGAAAVVMSVKTGEVLASASYPTFDLAGYPENYNEILKTDGNPLINRVLDSVYPPGSIYKMTTTVAALESGAIDLDIKVKDEGVYMRFADEGYYPRCMLWTTGYATHGTVGIAEALQVSCNYFFYEIGYRTGIDEIDRVGKAMGLGEHTGVELPESIGHRANPEVKAELYEGYKAVWYGGDTASASIGQSEHLYTPMQLVCYASTLANQGTRYKATFLKRVISADYSSLLYETSPVILSQMDIADETIDIVKKGMYRSANIGTASTYLNDMDDYYGLYVCAKTGTAEHGSGGSDNASFLVFAPQDDPEIAIAIYVEKGASSSKLGMVAREILVYYFSQTSSSDTAPGENRLN